LRITYSKESEPDAVILDSQYIKITETQGTQVMMLTRKLKEENPSCW